MTKTFVDTGAFCAFCDRRDSLHVIAVRQFSLMLKEKYPLITTNFIIDETYTWIRYRLGASEALEFIRKIRASESHRPPLEIVTISREIEDNAFHMLEKFADQDLSYTDATSLAVIKERKLSRAFTFDRHFHLLPIELVPGVAR